MMFVKLSEEAVRWFKEEIGVVNGEQIKFYVQFYGTSPIQDGYSLAFSKDNPISIAASTKEDGILFFIEESDLWFFDGHDLYVEYNEREETLEYRYIKP